MIEVVETNCRSELMMPSLKDQKKTKYKLIYDHLRKEISSGVYQPGSKMPTELELVKRYKSSRTTVAKALRNLEIKGLINRVQGSGTFCSKKNDTISLALLGPREIGDIRDPKTFTIFSQLVFPLSTFASQKNMSFILGNLPATDNNETDIKALQLCDNFIQQDVKCVLFLPLDYAVEDYSINEQITRKLSDANINVVLLDRDIYDGRTERSAYDIVGIDNVRAAYKATEHLIRHHCKRICIVYEETRNSVIVDRISGYIQAVTDNNLVIHKIKLNEYTDHVTNEIKTKLLSFEGDGVVCVNDRLAATVLRLLSENGIQVPDQMKVVGFDDLPLSEHLNPPLTTICQPVDALAREAIRTISSRLENPLELPREIRIHGELVIRHSCGC